jgi:hypothetical protein
LGTPPWVLWVPISIPFPHLADSDTGQRCPGQASGPILSAISEDWTQGFSEWSLLPPTPCGDQTQFLQFPDKTTTLPFDLNTRCPLFWDRVSLHSASWPWTPLASAFQVLRLQVCTSIPSRNLVLSSAWTVAWDSVH